MKIAYLTSKKEPLMSPCRHTKEGLCSDTRRPALTLLCVCEDCSLHGGRSQKVFFGIFHQDIPCSCRHGLAETAEKQPFLVVSAKQSWQAMHFLSLQCTMQEGASHPQTKTKMAADAATHTNTAGATHLHDPNVFPTRRAPKVNVQDLAEL